MAKPLTDLTIDKIVWHWGDTEQNSFLVLKAAMVTVPILCLPDFERHFVVATDASDVAIGAILEQYLGSGLQPIEPSSRKLNATEIRYSAYEPELLGIVWGIGQWKHYFRHHTPGLYKPIMRHLNTSSIRRLSIAEFGDGWKFCRGII